METVVPVTITTSVVKLRYVNSPELLDVGGVNVNDTSANDLGEIVKFVMVGVARVTVKFALMVALVKSGNVAACVAVITIWPARIIVTVRPDMVATFVSLLVNVNVADGKVFVDIGFMRSNGAEPYTRGATTKFDRKGVVGVVIGLYT
jgi:hypothetical protein